MIFDIFLFLEWKSWDLSFFWLKKKKKKQWCGKLTETNDHLFVGRNNWTGALVIVFHWKSEKPSFDCFFLERSPRTASYTPDRQVIPYWIRARQQGCGIISTQVSRQRAFRFIAMATISLFSYPPFLCLSLSAAIRRPTMSIDYETFCSGLIGRHLHYFILSELRSSCPNILKDHPFLIHSQRVVTTEDSPFWFNLLLLFFF